MTTSDFLTLVTLVLASVSLLLSSIALWPQSRQVLSLVRDVVLWMVLVFVFVGIATVGWRHFRVYYQPRILPQSADAWGKDPAGGDSAMIEVQLSPTPSAADPNSMAWQQAGR